MNGIVVGAGPLEGFLRAVLSKLQVDAFSADHLAGGLVQTSLRGVDSHGVRLFPHYVNALRGGRLNGKPSFRFLSKYKSAAVLDADHAFGHAAGAKAMLFAVERSRETGLCAVAVKDSSHFGAAAYFALLAAEQGAVGMAFTNADALVVPTNGVRPFFGTNPICCAVPVEGARPFCLDMATSQYNWNKVKRARESGELLPEGAAADERGLTTRDARAARGLRPSGDYKGYGLGAMIEIFCALFPGNPYGPDILPMFTAPISSRRSIGHFFIAMQIDAFAEPESFKKRMAQMLSRLRSEPRLTAHEPILAPGDPEWEAMDQRSRDGIPLTEAEQAAFEDLAAELGIPAPWSPARR